MARRLKVCAESGCGEVQVESRCAIHRTNLYGPAHQAERKRWTPLVATGTVECWRCGGPIAPGQRWDLGHADHNPNEYRGPECVPCNRATAGR